MNVKSLFTCARHPIVITAAADASADGLRRVLQLHRDELDSLLQVHGGILFRGFALNGAEDFRACAECLGAQPFDYVGGNTPRTPIAQDVYTSTEYPASEVISMHNEMSYLPRWPRRLFFYSLVPAQKGGQTSLANSRDVLRSIPADIVSRLRAKKVNYIRNFQPAKRLGKSWQATYLTDIREEVEQIIASQGSTHAWLPNGVLRVTTHCEPMLAHPQTGDELWFNQVHQWHPSALPAPIRAMYEDALGTGHLPHDCAYGDGEPLEEEALSEIRRALETNKLLFDWQRHDLLMIDNMLMMHGREPFKGERRTMAYLSAT
jgi:alpha-ketoglutarate-dependent taurine dioxygenase